ncbi:hypothetical protein K438DRAFT_1773270 [Mycena galopus ATCC 62051]|nr:hypothetical protein K438DRAFT_1773270 [Mycena galopus ATCC 62051]
MGNRQFDSIRRILSLFADGHFEKLAGVIKTNIQHSKPPVCFLKPYTAVIAAPWPYVLRDKASVPYTPREATYEQESSSLIPTTTMPRQLTDAKAHLDHITTCLTLALPLLKELNDAFGPPFVQSIVNTIQSLINLVQNVKQNKNECVQLMENIHHILTLHKIYTFVEAQQQGNKIMHFFHNHETNKLLQDCHAGLKQAQEMFGIQTQTQTLDEIREFRKAANFMHKEMMELIENLSETTVSERSSVYLGINESKNSSNSFSMLPSKPKIFHGREQELNHILKLISQQPPRIAILGGGGMGKTSLARAVLHHPDTSSKFEHRFFVSAEAATTSVELAALIGLHVGLKPGQDLTKPVVQYFSRKMSCLLILDNLESVWEPTHSQAGVEEFLSLLTSLEHLALIVCPQFFG